jgi:hypothetical protein
VEDPNGCSDGEDKQGAFFDIFILHVLHTLVHIHVSLVHMSVEKCVFVKIVVSRLHQLLL